MANALRILRNHGAVGILILYSLYHGLAMVKSSTLDYLHRAGPAPMTVFEKRFEPLKVRLSAYGCRKVGYITDIPEDRDWFTGFYETEYTLAPIIVDDSTDAPFVVANLQDRSSITSVIRERGLSLVADYENGVVLLSRQTR